MAYCSIEAILKACDEDELIRLTDDFDSGILDVQIYDSATCEIQLEPDI